MVAAACVAPLVSAAALPREPASAPPTTRLEARTEPLVAVGDVHGAYPALVSILEEAGLIDEDRRWSGGTTTFVQLGDFLDRGADTRAVMDLLMSLQSEAEAAGGRVVVLMGNHEVMHLISEFRDNNPDSYMAFASESTQKAREVEYRAVLKAARKRAFVGGRSGPVRDTGTKHVWLESHPPGTLPYLRAISPGGVYGDWLRSLPALVQVGETLLMHGGLSPDFAKLSVEEINATLRAEISKVDDCRTRLRDEDLLALSSTLGDMVAAAGALRSRLLQKTAKRSIDAEEQADLDLLAHCQDWQSWFLVREDSPFWFRGYSAPAPGLSGRWSDLEGGLRIDEILDAQGAERIVVGHTWQPGGKIGARFDDRVFLIDTGLLSSHYTGGRAAALEIRGEIVSAIYPGEREVLSASSGNAE